MAKKEKRDDYVVLMGTKLSKREANSAGLGIIFGISGGLLSFLTPIVETKIVVYGMILAFVCFGYYLGSKLFK